MERKLIRRAILLKLIFLSFVLTLRAERLPIRLYTSADGLGSSFVNNLMRDSRGFLWVCTRDGLSRFDGSRFITYQIGDRAPGIEQILETRSGIYWIVTTAGTYRFNPALPSREASANPDRPTLDAEFATTFRGAFVEDHAGNLWATGDGLYSLKEVAGRLNPERVDLNLPPNPASQFFVSTIVPDRDGSLWVSTSWGVVRRWPNGRITFYDHNLTGPDAMMTLFRDSEGRIWLGNLDSIFIIQPETEPPASTAPLIVRIDRVAEEKQISGNHLDLPKKPGAIVKYSTVIAAPRRYKYFYETADKHIWISASNKLVEVDGEVFRMHAQDIIKDSAIMLEDGNGNLWLGNYNVLARFDRRGLTSYGTDDGLKNTYFISINQGRDDRVYATAADWLVSTFDGNGFVTAQPPLPANATTMWTANTSYQDSAGEWWFLTNGTLFRFAATNDIRNLGHQKPLATYDHRDGLASDQPFHIFEDSRNDLWISTQLPSGLSRWSRSSGQFYSFAVTDGFPSDKTVSSFAEDKQGNLWFGFYDGGLVRYTGGRFTEFKAADGAPNGLITSLYLDQAGKLWIGSSQEGLSFVSDPNAARPEFIIINANKGLASNNVRAITGDLAGNIYLGTARGVDRISPDGARIRHYSINDGLAADFVTAAFCDRQGVLWFGTTNGVSRLVPPNDERANVPAVWISGLRIAGESRQLSQLGTAEIPRIELASTKNNLQIDFFGIDFSAGQLRYQYKLEGADNEWSLPTLQRLVTYANLAPGTYRFLVRAVSTDGLTSAQPATISFRILPPLWQRWWFLTALGLAMIGITYSLYRYRLSQLLKVERVRTRIATDLHDDIGASLSRMAILSEVVKQQTGTDGDQAGGLLTEIAESARGLVDSMGDIVWSIDPRRDDLQSVVRRLRQFASDVLEAKGIDWQLHVTPEVESLKLGPDERQHLFLIFKEGINNIVRHGEGAKSVSLSIRKEGRQLIGEITDDGCGFTPKSPGEARSKGLGGNGLPNMRERAAQLGGRLDIASSPGEGTRLVLQMPIRR